MCNNFVVDTNKIFAERFKELRKQSGLSAVLLSAELGTSDSTIIRWENNGATPMIEHLARIAKYFNVSADYLLGLQD